jgi:hypothetical protein
MTYDETRQLPPIMKLGRLAIWNCLTARKTIDGSDPTLTWLMGADPEEFKWTCAQPAPEFEYASK